VEQFKLVGQDAELETGLLHIRYQVEHFGTQDHVRRQFAVLAAEVLNGPVLANQATDFTCPLIPIATLGKRSAYYLPPQRIGPWVDRAGPGERAGSYSQELLDIGARFEEAFLDHCGEIQQQSPILPVFVALKPGVHACLVCVVVSGFLTAHQAARSKSRKAAQPRQPARGSLRLLAACPISRTKPQPVPDRHDLNPIAIFDRAPHVETRVASVGLVKGDDVEVRDGLVEGEMVVARAGAFVRDGDRVRPVAAIKPLPK
jgi:hypothetical protein